MHSKQHHYAIAARFEEQSTSEIKKRTSPRRRLDKEFEVGGASNSPIAPGAVVGDEKVKSFNLTSPSKTWHPAASILGEPLAEGKIS